MQGEVEEQGEEATRIGRIDKKKSMNLSSKGISV